LGADGVVVTKQTQVGRPPEEGYWRAEQVSGAPSIAIDLGNQKAYFYKAGQVVGMSPISSGREGYRTPTGRFSILEKDRDHLSTLYGDYVDSSGNVVVQNVGIEEDPKPAGTFFRGAPMPYFMRISDGVGMHAGYLPGVPDSHGCIRMPLRMAQIFYANAPSGTPVTVLRH
jgi:lipoprotein-anchoring transpeptidase ErfK/SrfK